MRSFAAGVLDTNTGLSNVMYVGTDGYGPLDSYRSAGRTCLGEHQCCWRTFDLGGSDGINQPQQFSDFWNRDGHFG